MRALFLLLKEESGDKTTIDLPREDEPGASEGVAAGQTPLSCSGCCTRGDLSVCSPDSRGSDVALLHKVVGMVQMRCGVL